MRAGRRALLAALSILACRPGNGKNVDSSCSSDDDCPAGQTCATGRCIAKTEVAAPPGVSEAIAGPAERPRVAWDVDLGSVITARPLPVVTAGGEHRVWVASHSGRVVAIASGGADRGRVVADLAVDGIVWSSPIADGDGRVWLGADDDTLYAIDAGGAIAARVRLGDCNPPRARGPEGVRCDVDGGPTLAPDGDLVVGADGIYRLGKDGEIRWHTPSGDGVRARHVFSTPLVTDALVVAGGFDGNVTALKTDGALAWTFAVGADVDGSPVTDASGTIYVGADDGKLYALKPDGALAWSWPTKGEIRSAATLGADGTIHVASGDGSLYALTPAGKLRWTFRTGGPLAAAPTIDREGRIYFGSRDDRVYALDAAGKLLWQLEFPADVDAQIAITPEGTLVVGCDDGHARGLVATASTG
ncbi:MAG TPA: PQQ-binding-like beta-propeller repeat protein [Nannocystaceae bacterium]|nr:PQQ-binding-like beta-propeller repeat protein [Nannocystaceae bacterium]